MGTLYIERSNTGALSFLSLMRTLSVHTSSSAGRPRSVAFTVTKTNFSRSGSSRLKI